MISMPSYSKNIIILVRYPFSDLSNAKVHPAVIVNAPHSSQDILIVPLTSKTGSLLDAEFILSDSAVAGLNVVTAVKRGIYTVSRSLVIRTVGKLADVDRLEQSLRGWLGL
jgi:mRNA interferase MazF